MGSCKDDLGAYNEPVVFDDATADALITAASNLSSTISLGLGYGIGAIAKVIGPYFVGALIGNGELTAEVVFLPFMVFAVLLLLGGVIYLFARETKGESLENI